MNKIRSIGYTIDCLLDDNKEVCEMWKTEKMRKSINVNRDGLTTIEALEKIYTELTK